MTHLVRVLDGTDSLLLIEALDALYEKRRNLVSDESVANDETLNAVGLLRERLVDSFSLEIMGGSRSWFESQLREEREAMGRAVLSELNRLLADPTVTKRAVIREQMRQLVVDLWGRRLYHPRPPGWLDRLYKMNWK